MSALLLSSYGSERTPAEVLVEARSLPLHRVLASNEECLSDVYAVSPHLSTSGDVGSVVTSRIDHPAELASRLVEFGESSVCSAAVLTDGRPFIGLVAVSGAALGAANDESFAQGLSSRNPLATPSYNNG